MENNIKQKNIKQQKVCDFSIKHSPNSQLFFKNSKKSSRKEIEEYNKRLSLAFQELDNKNTEVNNYKLILEGMRKSVNELQEKYDKERNSKNFENEITKEFEIQFNKIEDKEKIKLKNDNKLLNNKITEIKNEKINLENEINYLKENIKKLENQLKDYRAFTEKSENQYKETLNLKEKKINELLFENNKVKELEKQIEQLNELKKENEYLNYIHQNSFNYLNIIYEINTNFEMYSNIFKNDFYIKNIYNLCFYDIIFRIKNEEINKLSKDIFNNNILMKKNNENIDTINHSNSKILNYEKNLLTELEKIISNCKIFIEQYSNIYFITEFNFSGLYTLNNKKLQINLKQISGLKCLYLISILKYNIKEINSIELYGEILYDKDGKSDYIFDLAVNLVLTYKSQIKKLYLKDISKLKNSFINSVNIMIENFEECKEIYINNSNLEDDLFQNIKFKSNKFIYDKIDLSNNKLSKYFPLNKIQVKQLILSKNKIKFKDALKTELTDLDISENPTTIKDINSCLFGDNFYKINLSSIKIKDMNECKILINFINSLNKLEFLFLNNSKISSDILFEFLNKLHLTQIQEIYLSNNQFGDNGMKVICDFINKNESIKKIELKKCQITLKGLKELKNIKRKRSIKEIDLSENSFDIVLALDIIKDIEGIAFNL